MEGSMKIVQGEIEVENVQEFLRELNEKGCQVTFINADYVADLSHVEFAAKKAIKAWNEGKRISRSLTMEILLYTAATRQIWKALELGLKEGKNRVVAVVLNDCNLLKFGFHEEGVLKLDSSKIKRIMEFFEISDEELKIAEVEKLPLLVRERILLFCLSEF
jgi:KEOPS complex subunit Cgi121